MLDKYLQSIQEDENLLNEGRLSCTVKAVYLINLFRKDVRRGVQLCI